MRLPADNKIMQLPEMEYIHKSVVNITKKRIKMLQTVYRFQSSHTSVKERNLYTEKIKKYNIKETKNGRS